MPKEAPTVNVEVELPPGTSLPTTDQSNPSPPVLIVNPPAPSTDAFTADLLARIAAIENDNRSLHDQLAATQALTIASTVTTPEPTDPDPEPTEEEEEEPAELVVPDSSDAGPTAVPETPKRDKPAWHHWI